VALPPAVLVDQRPVFRHAAWLPELSPWRNVAF
jgi:hypothetical protein